MVAGRSNTENFFDINDDGHNADIEMVDIDGEDNTKSNMLSGQVEEIDDYNNDLR